MLMLIEEDYEADVDDDDCFSFFMDIDDLGVVGGGGGGGDRRRL